MRNAVRQLSGFILGGGLLWAGCCGCTKIHYGPGLPCTQPYTFIRNDAKYADLRRMVYESASLEKFKTRVVISHPASGMLDFRGVSRILLSRQSEDPVILGAGAYPFLLRDEPKAASRDLFAPAPPIPPARLSGALMVYNVDKDLELATLGKTKDTRVFNEGLFEKAASGVLAKFTIKYDERDVLTYWLGNRTTLYAGGEPTVEVDFSGTPGIEKLWINGENVPGLVATLDVYNVTIDRNTKAVLRTLREYMVEFRTAEHEYKGYLRNLKDNEFTAFVRIPCAVPKDLLQAADHGTVSRFEILSEGEKKEPVAELVLSGK